MTILTKDDYLKEIADAVTDRVLMRKILKYTEMYKADAVHSHDIAIKVELSNLKEKNKSLELKIHELSLDKNGLERIREAQKKKKESEFETNIEDIKTDLMNMTNMLQDIKINKCGIPFEGHEDRYAHFICLFKDKAQELIDMSFEYGNFLSGVHEIDDGLERIMSIADSLQYKLDV